MKTTIMVGAIVSIYILMMTPAVNAVEYNVAVDTVTARFIDEIKHIDIDQLEQKLRDINNPILQEKLQSIDFVQLKQKVQALDDGSDLLVDFEYLFLLLSNFLCTIITGEFNLLRSFYTLLFLWIIAIEIISGEPVPICPKAQAAIIFGLSNIIASLEYRLIENKFLEQLVMSITVIIAYLIYFMILPTLT